MNKKILITAFFASLLFGGGLNHYIQKKKKENISLQTPLTKDKKIKEKKNNQPSEEKKPLNNKDNNNQETKKDNDIKPKKEEKCPEIITTPKKIEAEEEGFFYSWKFAILLSLIFFLISAALIYGLSRDDKRWQIFTLLFKINKEQKKLINSKPEEIKNEHIDENINNMNTEIMKLRESLKRENGNYEGEHIDIVSEMTGLISLLSFFLHFIAIVILPFFLAKFNKNKENHFWRFLHIFVKNLKLLLSFILIALLSYACGLILIYNYNNTSAKYLEKLEKINEL